MSAQKRVSLIAGAKAAVDLADKHEADRLEAERLEAERQQEAERVAAEKRAAAEQEAAAGSEKPKKKSKFQPGMTSATIHLPVALLLKLRLEAARRISERERGRPSVSEVVVDLLQRHLDEIEGGGKG